MRALTRDEFRISNAFIFYGDSCYAGHVSSHSEWRYALVEKVVAFPQAVLPSKFSQLFE